mmetsp:Transcript_63380/g.151468  ORF Transcript_63380/g.151468 Transcript_63380/m.151468 type:complete len:96 (-) Transcript_63380:552-839(-)
MRHGAAHNVAFSCGAASKLERTRPCGNLKPGGLPLICSTAYWQQFVAEIRRAGPNIILVGVLDGGTSVETRSLISLAICVKASSTLWACLALVSK